MLCNVILWHIFLICKPEAQSLTLMLPTGLAAIVWLVSVEVPVDEDAARENDTI